MSTSKPALKELVVKGRTDLVLQKIVAATKPLDDQHFYNQAAALSGRWSTNERNNNLGTLSAEEYKLEKERINHAVLALIDQFPERSALLRLVLIAAVGMLVLYLLFKFMGRDDSMQLTVYVQDAAGKPIAELQNKGKVIVDFGNDRRSPLIGEDGRTNLGEIPEKFRGGPIPIVLEAEGYEPIEPDKKYVLNGKQVYFLVRRDNSLGIVYGRVTTRDGNEFIAGALVIVSAEGGDTSTHTDSMGYFRLLLPEKMHRREYPLIVKKIGFQVARDKFVPRSTPLDIRLDRED
ncbi:MAG: hypothetical protein H7246_07140 [Phycisphaerae bacterium]|nr:hypothetical protein [Saprospiraceae bacterium]